MAYIRTLSSGKYRVEIRKNHNTIQNKTILSIKPKKLKNLSPAKVEGLGGIMLFQKLGVDVDFLSFKTLANE